jgi:hypothetical protein
MRHVKTTWTAAAVAAALGATVGFAEATPQMLTAAKGAGMPVKNCQYCHTEAVPKKETFKPESLNDRGKYLLADKDQRKLKAVDMEKLKDFPGGKDQK